MLSGMESRGVPKVLEPIEVKLHRFRGIEVLGKLNKIFRDDKPVLVYFDPDIDGLISGLFVCKLMKMLNREFVWYINENRKHGFLLNPKELRGFNIIAVDFQIPANLVSEIVENGSNIVSMDHHLNGSDFIEVERNGVYGVVINNQYPFEEDDSRYLSGAGVVFESIVWNFPEFNTMENRALVGLTLLSDVRDIENRNARGYLTDLYSHKCRGYIKYLIESVIPERDYGFGIPRLTRNFVDYTLSPVINSCLRFNKGDMVVKFILGSNYIDTGMRTLQRELVSRLKDSAEVVVGDGITFILVDKSKLSDEDASVCSNFIGLVASEYLSTGNSCIAMVNNENGELERASFRGKVNNVNYIDCLNASGLLYGEGHGSAFGVLEINPTKRVFKGIGRICHELEEDVDTSVNIVYVKNMSMFVGAKGYRVGIENIFCLSQNMTYVKYDGDNVVKRRFGVKYTEYMIDDVSVMCFDLDLDPRKDLILPVVDRGVVYFYLRKKSCED